MNEPMTTAEGGAPPRHKPRLPYNLRCWGTGPRWRRVGARGVRYDKADLDHWKAQEAEFGARLTVRKGLITPNGRSCSIRRKPSHGRRP